MKKINTKKEFIIEMPGVFIFFLHFLYPFPVTFFLIRLTIIINVNNLARSYGKTGNFQLILAFDRFCLVFPIRKY